MVAQCVDYGRLVGSAGLVFFAGFLRIFCFEFQPYDFFTINSQFSVNTILLLIIAFGIYGKRVPPKRLLFVANRSVVDAIAAGISLVYLYKVEVQCDKFGLFFYDFGAIGLKTLFMQKLFLVSGENFAFSKLFSNFLHLFQFFKCFF